ncbi:DEAD/DEAH box helicase [Candidatus Woesearchaeota archaeon]|nr:DEAD/DEAH box helicase [Candidatus Woesearchaeota archaeon]
MLRDFEPRLYQETIFNTCTEKNTLVVLPTGMGKTAIAMMLAAHRLKLYPNSKILFLAPTKPLAEQHLQSFKKSFVIDESKLALFTGDTPPDERVAMWQTVQIVFSTPQGLENDVISSKIALEDVSLMIFDEAHRATGDYSYVFLAKQYNRKAKFPKILALTASPGSEMIKIDELCKNLFIESVEVRTDNDPDVKPYIQEVEFEWIKLELPELFKQIQGYLNSCIRTKLAEIKRYGLTQSVQFISKKDLLGMQAELRARMTSGQRDFETLKSISLTAEIIKVQHALELLETQCISSLHAYFTKVFEDARAGQSKAVKNLVQDLHWKSAFVLVNKAHDLGVEHPKLNALRGIVEQELVNNKFAKIIVFTQYRDTAVKIKQELDKAKTLSEIFVGQAKKKTTGLSQKQQIEMLQQFRDGLFSVLIATSVAEEGLDIPRVDSVIFYEPIPSAIRTIQRRGRTGRQEKGRVVMLMAKGTRDEAFSWSAKNKEKSMHKFLDDLRTHGHKLAAQSQQTIATFTQEKVRIFADYREKASGVVKELVEQGVDISLEMMPSADYVLSPRVAIEFKTCQDFVDSIIDGRLLEQLKALKEHYERPIIVVEGAEDIYALRNVHPNAIRGMLATIAVSYGIPILRTKDFKDTAGLLISIAKREQSGEKRDFAPHADKKPMTLKESQEYVVSSLPNIGPNLAKELLKAFGSVKNVINASDEELKKVEGVGEKKAQGIKDVSEKEYDEHKSI